MNNEKMSEPVYYDFMQNYFTMYHFQKQINILSVKFLWFKIFAFIADFTKIIIVNKKFNQYIMKNASSLFKSKVFEVDIYDNLPIRIKGIISNYGIIKLKKFCPRIQSMISIINHLNTSDKIKEIQIDTNLNENSLKTCFFYFLQLNEKIYSYENLFLKCKYLTNSLNVILLKKIII